MADSVRVTPASRKIEFFNPTTASAKSTISLDTNGNLTIVADGTIDIGDTSADIYVGDGSSNVDIVYTADGEIRTEGSGVELSLVSSETISIGGSHQSFSLGKRAVNNTGGRTILLEGLAASTNGEASSRIFFTEHNNTTALTDKYGLSLYYQGDGSTATLPSGAVLSSGNATWGLMRHDNSQNGTIIMGGVRGNSNVGFGTFAPTEKVTIRDGDLCLHNPTAAESLDTGDILNRILFRKHSNGNRTLMIYNTSGDDSGGHDYHSSDLRVAGRVRGSGDTLVDRFTIVGHTGNVGIGTTNPQWDLSVPGDVTIGWYNNFTGTNTGTAASDATLRVAGRAFDKPAIIELANFDANNYYGGTNTFHLGTLAFAMNENSNTVTRVASVEAWTEDPNEEGHFDGRLLFKTSEGDASGASLTTKVVIDGNGFVGIGTDTPDGLLDVSSASTVNVYYTKTATPCTFHTQVQTSAVIMGTTTNHNLQFKANGGVRMTLQPGGNVGINDTTPSYKLDVNGDIRAQDDMYTDKLIASEGIRSSMRNAFNTMQMWYYDRQSMGTSAVYLRVPVGGSSSANPGFYAMPHAGKVMMAMFAFYGQTLATSGTDTWTIHKINTGGSTTSVNFDIDFASLNRIGTTNNYNILVDVAVLSDASNIDFVLGDILQIQRSGGDLIDIEHVNAQLWVVYDI